MKKGLAIVLAAATALTFAPVSTLGLTGVVQAEASQKMTQPDVVNYDVVKTITLSTGSHYTLTTTGVTDPTTSTALGDVAANATGVNIVLNARPNQTPGTVTAGGDIDGSKVASITLTYHQTTNTTWTDANQKFILWGPKAGTALTSTDNTKKEDIDFTKLQTAQKNKFTSDTSEYTAEQAGLVSVSQASTTEDGLKPTEGIDSDPANITLAPGEKSSVITLKEHNDKSVKNGKQTHVGAFRIRINRVHENNDPNKKYVDLVQAIAAKDGTVADFQNPVKNEETSNLGELPQNGKTWASSDKVTDDTSTRIYTIKNKDTVTTDTNLILGLFGSQFRLQAEDADADNGVYETNVTVESLATATSSEVLNSSTFTVKITHNGEKFTLGDADHIVAEDSTLKIPYTVEHGVEWLNGSSHKAHTVDVISDNQSVVADQTSSADIYNGYNEGKIAIKIGAEGTANLKIKYHYIDPATGDDKTQDASYNVKVTPKNGKLTVSYTAADGQYMTYTDDASINTETGNANVKRAYETNYITPGTAGTFDVKSTALNNVDQDKYDLNTAAGATELVKDYDAAEAGSPNSEKVKLAYHFPTYDLYKPAAPLTSDGKTSIQISANSAVQGATVKYSLVAASSYTDANSKAHATKLADRSTTESVALGNDLTLSGKIDGKYVFTRKYNNAANNAYIKVSGGSDDVTSSNIGEDDSITFSEAKAAEYGSIDQNGLVTLKDAKNAPTLYVVVTVAKKDAVENKTAARAVSTIMIPISMHKNATSNLYVSDSLGFADEDVYYGVNSGATSQYHLYLNLTDRTSDTLKIGGNVPANYVTVTSDDPTKVSVDGLKLTAIKETGNDPVTVTVKSSSVPNLEGIVIARIKVEVNKLSSAQASKQPTLTGVYVNKTKPSEKIVTNPTSGVIFDSTIYVPDDSKSRVFPYRAAQPDDDAYGDITVSTTGVVTYQKDHGEAYVRAYIAGDSKNNPSTWQYVKVSYGEDLVANELKVDKTSVVTKVGGSDKITATAATGSAISFTSADPSVATVDAQGNVKALKVGQTTITVDAAATSTVAAAQTVIPVVVTDENGDITPADTVKKPAKVTGVKVKNKKGGKVTVTWTKQNQKNIKYYVKKTVGKKSAGKSVNGGKTTLSVKKGATVKVKVKAYIYNASGKKLVGSYSKTVTLKTDKK